jgi:DNA-binding Xre family transcriptional regulator
MPGRINNRLRLLLAEKAMREHRNIPLKQLQRETGIAWSTLNSWANNHVSRYDAPIIATLCGYFKC